MTAYKDKKTVNFQMNRTMDKDGVRDSSIVLSSHTGTHIDAPTHFLRDGLTIDEIHLERLVGPCKVLSMTTIEEKVTADDLAQHSIAEGDIILLKTNNSAYGINDSFDYDYVYLDPSGAQFLADKKIKAVGLDYLSIERSHPEHPTHMTLFHHDVVVIEGLRLAHVPAGEYLFVCLPLAIIGLEAAPARAVLVEASNW